MKIAFISDIHTDFYIPASLNGHKLDKAMDDFIDKILCPKPADVIVFAGDNSHYPQQNKLMLEKLVAKKLYKKIFITFGNHDMYLISRLQEAKFKTSWNKIIHFKSICEEIETVEFLDGNIVEVDGVKFGGCGMWYDFSYGIKNFNQNHYQMIQRWKSVMNDASLIKSNDFPREINDLSEQLNSGYGFKPTVKKYSFDPIKFFKEQEKKMLKIIDNCDVFVSHVGPLVPPNLSPKYQNPDTGFYFFDGEYLLERETAPKLWIFGHVHETYFWKHEKTVLACNPLGYKSENRRQEVQVLDFNNLF